MKQPLLTVALINCFIYNVHSYNLPGPLVYVVTPSPKPPQLDMGRAAPFYYRNWMKRMDTPSVTPAATTEKPKTPDLIFAEFESDNTNIKSIRNLLQKERYEPKTTTTTTTTTTSSPIYVPDEDTSASDLNYGLPRPTTEKPTKADMTDYFALYNNLYNSGPIYVPNASSPSNSTSTTTESPVNNVENIWHIIDNEKQDEYSGKWTEESINPKQTASEALNENNDHGDDDKSNENQTEDESGIGDNFALPGFGTNPGNGAENESRAIRTEPSIRFPYVNLKPFKMKNFNSKKANNMFNLDSFTEIKNPVRGEIQDMAMMPVRQPIDRYNPAQPYLPDYGIGTKTKQGSAPPAPLIPAPRPQSPQSRPPPPKTVANLVPPPLPPAPKLTADDFPTPTSYESFPPYPSGDPAPGPSFSFPSTGDSGPDSSSDDSGPPSAPPAGPPSGYSYKPPASAPAPPAPSFVPTLPPLSKPFSGYSYNKPPMEQDAPPTMGMGGKPDFQGYHYSKPESPSAPPSPPDNPSHSYGDHDAPPPSYQPESDYPDLIFDKPHGGMGDIKAGDAMKDNDMGMMPPPPPADMKPDSDGPPMDDHGFPHDFPGDFKYSHDFDEHDYHHHYHHPTTTTTTTEMPRVNRFSYYYLGKKLYYLPLYFSVYFVAYVGALIIKAVLRHKITYPNSFRPNTQTATFFSKRSIEEHLSNENLHEITGRVTHAIATAAEKYISKKSKEQ